MRRYPITEVVINEIKAALPRGYILRGNQGLSQYKAEIWLDIPPYSVIVRHNTKANRLIGIGSFKIKNDQLLIARIRVWNDGRIMCKLARGCTPGRSSALKRITEVRLEEQDSIERLEQWASRLIHTKKPWHSIPRSRKRKPR